MNDQEVWKDIQGYEGLYQVSDFGRVRSFKRSSGHVVLKQNNTRGYMQVVLSNSDRVRQTYSVHRLVATAFIPNPDKLPVINHVDRNRGNNRVSNLEWTTASLNVLHTYKVYHAVRGDEHYISKLSESDAQNVYELAWSGTLTQSKIATLFNVSRSTVETIKHGHAWNHVTQDLQCVKTTPEDVKNMKINHASIFKEFYEKCYRLMRLKMQTI
jgi:hypothetical protein